MARQTFLIRAFRPADFDDVLAAIQAADQADGKRETMRAADLRVAMNDPAWRQEETFVAETPDQRIAGYATGFLRRGPEGLLYLTDGVVHPAWRRQGAGLALLTRQWERAQKLALANEQPLTLGGRAFSTQTGALALLERFGLTRVRYFCEMRRSLAEPIPALIVPAGLTLRTLRAGDDDLTVLHAMNEAFADHWNHVESSLAEYQHRLTNGRTTPEASFVAWDGDEVAGGVLNDLGPDAGVRRGQNHGWVSILFVRRPWRHHGLGRALLTASLQAAAQRGFAGAGLNVDADNLTGAVRLYEEIGFRTVATRLAFQKRCDWPTAPSPA